MFSLLGILLLRGWLLGDLDHVTPHSLLDPDEKNGIPNSPQAATLTLDLDPEKEPELEPELDEPQKPEKPSVFIVFHKVWLGGDPQPPPLGKKGGTPSPVLTRGS